MDRSTPEPSAAERSRAARQRSMAQGGFWGIGTMGVALPYALLAGGRHQTALVWLAAGGVAMSLGLGVTASLWPGIVRARRPVIYLYTVLHIALTAALAICDGGADSPMALGFFGTFTFTAYTMPLRLLPFFGAVNVAGYLGVYAVAGASRPAYVPVALAGLLATAAACAHQHWRLSEQRRRLHEMARVDPLTGCLNRRGFFERVEAMAGGANATLVLMADLDDFKAVNDRHGHATGDERLRAAGTTLRTMLGEAAVIGRLGGDEFSAVIPYGRGREVDLDGLAARLGASVGRARRERESIEIGTLLELADRDLYARKRARRTPALSAELAG